MRQPMCYFFVLMMLFFSASCDTDAERRLDEIASMDTLYVKIAEVQDSSFVDTVRLQGRLIPFREANLGVAMPGRVEQVYYSKGSYVEKGSLLVQLSNEMLLQKEAEKNAIEKDYRRIKNLYENNSVARQEYDHIRAKYESAQAECAMLEKNTRVTAPFDGVIADVMTQPHENYSLSPFLESGYSNTSGILKLIQTDTLLVAFQLHERYLSAISADDTLRVMVSAFSDSILDLNVWQLGAYLSATYHMADVELLLTNPNRLFKAGMSCNVYLDFPAQSGSSLPLEAVMRQPGSNEDFVLVLQGRTYQQKKIEVLYASGSTVFVQGLSPGDTVITEGKLNVRKDRLLMVKE